MMANSYYSSDEDVAWGPLSLAEIKKDLSHSKKIRRRETDIATFFTPQSTFCVDQGAEDCTKTDSGASVYLTPNDSLQSHSDKNSLFPEQLSKIREEEKCNSGESPLWDRRNDSLKKILERANCDNLENIQQTPVENTLRVSYIELESSSSDEEDDVIVISDESISDEEDTYEPIVPCVKIEDCSQLVEELSLNQTENKTDECDPELECSLSSHESSNVSQDDSNKFEDHHSFNTKSSNYSSGEKSASPVFNDTLEEMEMALGQGLDYVMPGDDSLPKNHSEKPTCIPRPKKQLKTPNKFDHIESSIAHYIKKKSPIQDNFKQPVRPPKSGLTPNSKSPQVRVNPFKNIVSPVGVYIKNTPTCLKQKVQVKTVPHIKSSTEEGTRIVSQSNIPLPEVIYKPGRKVVTSVKEDVNLPPNIQKMVLEPIITKHEARSNVNKSEIAKKLFDGDLTTTNSSLLEQDVSFVQIKQAYIK